MSRARQATVAAAAAAPLVVAVMMANPAAATTSPSAYVADDTLIVKGTSAADLIALRLEAGAPGMLQVDFGDDALAELALDRTTFSRIKVRLLSGTTSSASTRPTACSPTRRPRSRVGGATTPQRRRRGRAVHRWFGDDTVDGNRGNDTA